MLATARGSESARPRAGPPARHGLGRRAGALPARRRGRPGRPAHPGELSDSRWARWRGCVKVDAVRPTRRLRRPPARRRRGLACVVAVMVTVGGGVAGCTGTARSRHAGTAPVQPTGANPPARDPAAEAAADSWPSFRRGPRRPGPDALDQPLRRRRTPPPQLVARLPARRRDPMGNVENTDSGGIGRAGAGAHRRAADGRGRAERPAGITAADRHRPGVRLGHPDQVRHGPAAQRDGVRRGRPDPTSPRPPGGAPAPSSPRSASTSTSRPTPTCSARPATS